MAWKRRGYKQCEARLIQLLRWRFEAAKFKPKITCKLAIFFICTSFRTRQTQRDDLFHGDFLLCYITPILLYKAKTITQLISAANGIPQGGTRFDF
jgi:hypothetical protein